MKTFFVSLVVTVLGGIILLYLEHNTNIFHPIKVNSPIIHVVKEGETLSKIAEDYRVPINRIIKDNNLKREPVYETVYIRKFNGKARDKRGKMHTYYKTVPAIKKIRDDYLVKEGQKLKIMK